MNRYKLYLDDIRKPSDSTFIVLRTFDDAVEYVLKHGMPEYISFDHDLGMDEKGELLKSGYDFAKWLIEADLDETIQIPKSFTFNVHSANPVGREAIESSLERYLKYKWNQNR